MANPSPSAVRRPSVVDLDQAPPVLSGAVLQRTRLRTGIATAAAAGTRTVAGSVATHQHARTDATVAVPRADTAGRIQLTAVGRLLGWTAGTMVDAAVDPDTGTVTLGHDVHDATDPLRRSQCPFDDKGRLGLTPAARAALGLPDRGQVLVVADPTTGRAVLCSVGLATALLDLLPAPTPHDTTTP